MTRLIASYDPKAELWHGKVDNLPIYAEGVTLDDLVAKAWEMIREKTDDQVGEFELIAQFRDGGLLETMHLMRAPANARRLDEAIANVAAGKVVKRDL
jgi:hypothetical protein